MVKSKQLDFTGQAIFLGIDTHRCNWKVTIRSGSNLSLKTFSMNPSTKELASHLKKNYPGATYRSVYEAGFSGYWIHRDLQQLGINNIIVNPADVPTTNKEKDRKSDPIDSNKLSRELCNGSLSGIYVPDPHHESIRVLSRFLRQYGSRNTQIKNRIKSLLHFLGIDYDFPDVKLHWCRAYIAKLSSLQCNEKYNAFVLKQHLTELDHVRKQRLAALREIRHISKENGIIKLLRSVPGVGVITAFTVYAELVDMRRFANLDQLASYVGLVPSTASSDNTMIIKGLTHRHCRYLRYMLIEAAWIAVRKDPALTLCFETLCKGMSKQRAIVRIAKKLLSRIRYVWLNKKEYSNGMIETQKEPRSKEPAKDNRFIQQAHAAVIGKEYSQSSVTVAHGNNPKANKRYGKRIIAGALPQTPRFSEAYR